MSRVLIVDDDALAATAMARTLRQAGYHVARSCRGPDAFDVARDRRPEVVLIELVLSDLSGIEVLAGMRLLMPAAACIVITAPESWPSLIAAMRAGACDCLEKPVREAELLGAVNRALLRVAPGHPAIPDAEPHAYLRLASKAVEFIASPNDAPTLRDFGRATGVSVGGFRSWCRTAGVRPRTYLLLARALRTVYRRERNPSEHIENLLQISDKRTLDKFIVAIAGSRDEMPSTVDLLLASQRLVNADAVAAIRLALARNGPILVTS